MFDRKEGEAGSEEGRRKFDVHQTNVQGAVLALLVRVDRIAEGITDVNAVAFECIDILAVFRRNELSKVSVPIGNSVVTEHAQGRLAVSHSLRHAQLFVQFCLCQSEKPIFEIRCSRKRIGEQTEEDNDRDNTARTEA